MNQLVGKDKDGNVFVMLVLEPGNLHRMKNGEPARVRLEDLFLDRIPAQCSVLIAYSETPIAMQKLIEKEFMGPRSVKFDERAAKIEKQRPHCPECHSTIEQLGVWRNESPMAIVFCTMCGCTLGMAPSEVVVKLTSNQPSIESRKEVA